MSLLESPLIHRLIALAIEEDLAGGDVTSELTVPESLQGTARIIVREPLVVCGTPLIPSIFGALTSRCVFQVHAQDGSEVREGEVLAEVRGPVRTLLAAERTVLNFLQRLSGIATHTRRLVQEAGDLTLLDTRKTTPGWRQLEKYAVRVGGARNHRSTLSEMVLVKNNHIDANGGSVARTLERVLREKPWYLPVEVEVRNLEELREVLKFQVDAVMFDNMNDPQIAEALAEVQAHPRPPQVEVSGGISEKRFAQLRQLGIRACSMGALVGKARTVDISMRVVRADEVQI